MGFNMPIIVADFEYAGMDQRDYELEEASMHTITARPFGEALGVTY